jgi:Tfp pilus assembly protein PilV
MRSKARSIGRCCRKPGFTLIDTALATIIVGVGVMAVMQLLATGTTNNYDGAQQTTAANLAKNIREMCLNLDFVDPNNPNNWGQNASQYSSNPATIVGLNNLAGVTFCPPVDSRKVAIAGWTDWQQAVNVQTVNPNLLTASAPNGSEPAVQITVTVSHLGQPFYTMSWYAFDGAPP